MVWGVRLLAASRANAELPATPLDQRRPAETTTVQPDAVRRATPREDVTCDEAGRIPELETQLDALRRELDRRASVVDPFERAPTGARPDAFRTAVETLIAEGEWGVTVDCGAYPCLAIAEVPADGDPEQLSGRLAQYVGTGVGLEIVRMSVADASGQKRDISAIAAVRAGETLDASARRGIQGRILRAL